MKQTVTVIDHKQKIVLYRLPQPGSVRHRQVGKGLTLWGDGDILRMPYELHDVEDDHRFADGLAPDEVKVAPAPNCLLPYCVTSSVRVIEVRDIKIADIVVGQNRRPLNPKKVEEVAASMSEIGQSNPITVCPRDDGRFDLVSGGHRIAAKKSLGLNDIRAQIVEGPEIDVRLWGIADDLHRAGLTALEEAERLAEWVKLIEERHSIDRENVSERKGGRPEGAITKAARELPLKGKTHNARRKGIERAMTIASLSPEAKAAARDAGLDDNRSALRKIAHEGAPEAQIAKVQEIAKGKATPKPNPWKRCIGTMKNGRAKTSKRMPAHSSMSATEQKCLASLLDAWNREPKLRDGFPKAPEIVRDRFVEAIKQSVADHDNDDGSGSDEHQDQEQDQDQDQDQEQEEEQDQAQDQDQEDEDRNRWV
jgi:ParB/RepB/Spo0J family partition protein